MSMIASKLKSTAIAALAITVMAGGLTTFSATEAEAQWRRHNRGAAVAAGIIGGIAAGALIAGAARPAYAAPVYGHGYGYAPVQHHYQPTYHHYQPVHSYNQPVYGYQPTCYTRRVRQVIDYDTVVIRRVRVCE